MVKIKPFRAIFYNQEKITDMSKIICPPYDVILPEEEDKYYNLHPFNMVNLILSRKKGSMDKYTNAKRIFSEWLNKGILKRDESECFYLYEQKYLFRKKRRKRVGFFGLLNLSDKKIFEHEYTRKAPKQDRLLLLKSVRANLCPIFVIFRDEKKVLSKIYKKFKWRLPFIKILNQEGVSHKLWRIEENTFITEIIQALREKKIFIADGHHRYEAACVYRDLRRRELKKITGQENFNYILTYFTDINSQGLIVLPIHRAIKRDNKILKILENYFEIRERKDKFNSFRCRESEIIMYKDNKFFTLFLKKTNFLDKIVDVQVLDFLFKESNLEEKDIIYSQDVNRIIEAINKKEAKIGFFLSPLKIEQIMRISSKREKLPLKSSYFYPKIPSGLLINKFEED